MNDQLPIELYLATRPETPGAVEHMCALAATRSAGDAVAVAVSPSSVSRASNLLFGTGIGVVSALDEIESHNLVSLARLSVATGATEVALPRVVLDHAAAVSRLKAFLGSRTAVTVDVTSPDGDADLAQAEYSLLLGADYVAFAPSQLTANPTNQMANLVALAGELQLGGVKVATSDDRYICTLKVNDWARLDGNARHCLPIVPPDG